MREYPMYEVTIPDSSVIEFGGSEYAALQEFMREKEIEDSDMQRYWADNSDTYCEITEEAWITLGDLIESFRTAFYKATGVNIFPFEIASDAPSENAGQVLWGSNFELSEKLSKLGAGLEVWTEFG